MSVQLTSNSLDHPINSGEIVKRSAVDSSINGYNGDIFPPHPRHFPPCITYDTTGISSRAASVRLQRGQCERGKTIDSPTGTRRPTTLKKEPRRREYIKMNTCIISNQAIIYYDGLSRTPERFKSSSAIGPPGLVWTPRSALMSFTLYDNLLFSLAILTYKLFSS